jgi:integrase
MIKRSPLKSDLPGKRSRWHVIVYNKGTKRSDWHTVRGTKGDAKALERRFADAKSNGDSNKTLERKTFEEVAKLFLDDRRATHRRISTLEEYQIELKIRLLPQPNGKLPRLGPRDIRDIRHVDTRAHFNALRNGGCTTSQVNKAIKTAKAIFTYAFNSEYVASSIMERCPTLGCVDCESTPNREVFTATELRSIFAAATPFELGLFGMLSISGARPSEICALDWSAVYLDIDRPYFRIERSWCSKGSRYYAPKTKAARRTVPMATWLASLLRERRTTSSGEGLVFPSTVGTPLNNANVRIRLWMPLLERAQVRYRDMESLRWTFVNLARVSGEAAFNVSRLIGHARSTIVDTIYAHTVDPALAGVSESVTKRVGLTPPAHTA